MEYFVLTFNSLNVFTICFLYALLKVKTANHKHIKIKWFYSNHYKDADVTFSPKVLPDRTNYPLCVTYYSVDVLGKGYVFIKNRFK